METPFAATGSTMESRSGSSTLSGSTLSTVLASARQSIWQLPQSGGGRGVYSLLRGRLGERLVDQLLGQRRVGAIAVLLLDRADHAAGHLGILRRQLGDGGG